MSRDAFPIVEKDLLPLSLGAALLGTGGGGNPYVGMLGVRELMRRGASVEVLPLDALPGDAYVGSVGGIGAPVVSIEKLDQGQEYLSALRAVEEAAGVKVSALISDAQAMQSSICLVECGSLRASWKKNSMKPQKSRRQ